VRPSTLSAGLLAACVLASCGRGVPSGRGPEEAGRRARATREGYRPPPDGVLTAAQVEAFLRIRQETLRTRSSAGSSAPLEGEEGISGAADARAGEMRAARALSVPVEEYLWVRERILEAEAASLTARLNADVLALLGRTIESLRERRATAPDDASRQLLDEQVASFEAEAVRVRREAGEKEPESVRANLAVLGPYRSRLSAISDELAELRAGAAAAPAPPRP